MRYHNITKADMLNGPGIRVVLWVAGCEHYCKDCQNPITWDPKGGLEFDEAAKKELFGELSKDYVSGITLSGGDPMHTNNVVTLITLCKEIRKEFPDKTIWLYTGYKWEDLIRVIGVRFILLKLVDVIVDGEFIPELADIQYHWAGSTNQRVIDVQKSRQKGEIVLYADN